VPCDEHRLRTAQAIAVKRTRASEAAPRQGADGHGLAAPVRRRRGLRPAACAPTGKPKAPLPEATGLLVRRLWGRRPTLPPGLPGSTIGAGGLNFSVRNGKRCDPSAIATPHQKDDRYETRVNSVKAPAEDKYTDQASRLISTGRLKPSRALHLRPIDVVISNEPSGGLCPGIPHLGVCFALRGFQRLSRPHIATRQCPWQNNRYTRGPFAPVLSY
jgi:hypothetical protein